MSTPRRRARLCAVLCLLAFALIANGLFAAGMPYGCPAMTSAAHASAPDGACAGHAVKSPAATPHRASGDEPACCAGHVCACNAPGVALDACAPASMPHESHIARNAASASRVETVRTATPLRPPIA